MNEERTQPSRFIHALKNIVLGGLIASVVFHWVQPIRYPRDTFLFRPDDRFGDFTNWIDYQHYWLGSQWAIPPFSLVLATLWKEVAGMTTPFAAFCLYSALAVGLHARIVFIELRRWLGRVDFSTWAILSFLPYPVLMAFDRGNIAWYVYLALYGFFHFCRNGRYQWAALCLALAASIKIIPLLLIVYLLIKGKPWALVSALAETAALTLLSYFIVAYYLVPDYSWEKILQGLKDYQDIYASKGGGLSFSHSLHSLLLLVPLVYRWESGYTEFSPGLAATILDISTALSGLLVFLTCAGVIWKRRLLGDYKISSLLVLLLLLAPPVSADYYLLFCYLLFFDLLRFDLHPITLKIYFLCLALLMIPKAYYVFFGEVNVGVLLNPILLIVMFVCLVLSRQGEPIPVPAPAEMAKETGKRKRR